MRKSHVLPRLVLHSTGGALFLLRLPAAPAAPAACATRIRCLARQWQVGNTAVSGTKHLIKYRRCIIIIIHNRTLQTLQMVRVSIPPGRAVQVPGGAARATSQPQFTFLRPPSPRCLLLAKRPPICRRSNPIPGRTCHTPLSLCTFATPEPAHLNSLLLVAGDLTTSTTFDGQRDQPSQHCPAACTSQCQHANSPRFLFLSPLLSFQTQNATLATLLLCGPFTHSFFPFVCFCSLFRAPCVHWAVIKFAGHFLFPNLLFPILPSFNLPSPSPSRPSLFAVPASPLTCRRAS